MAASTEEEKMDEDLENKDCFEKRPKTTNVFLVCFVLLNLVLLGMMVYMLYEAEEGTICGVDCALCKLTEECDPLTGPTKCSDGAFLITLDPTK